MFQHHATWLKPQVSNIIGVLRKGVPTYNYGIAFTKVFLSFCVVCSHFWNPGDLAYYPVAMLNRMRGAAVPIFVLMAFFLTEKIFVFCELNVVEREMLLSLFLKLENFLFYLGYLL